MVIRSECITSILYYHSKVLLGFSVLSFFISIATSEENLFAVLLREKSKIDLGYFNYLALLSQLK